MGRGAEVMTADVTLIRLALIPLSLSLTTQYPVPGDQSEIVCRFVQGIDSVIRFGNFPEREEGILSV